MEWDYSGRKGRDGQKKKIGKANERKKKVKGGKDEEAYGQGGRGVPWPHTGLKFICIKTTNSVKGMNITVKNIQYHLLYTITNLHHANKALTEVPEHIG